MAIAKLVSNEAPNKSRTVPKAARNESVEKVSSTMFTETFLNSVIDMLRGFNEDIMRLQESSKKILRSFASLIKSVRELNKDITNRFKTLNADLNASKLEFMRNILTAPITLPSGETITVAQTKTAEKEKPQEGGGSIFDFLLDLLPDGAGKKGKGTTAGAAKEGLKRVLQSFGRLAGPLGLVATLATTDESKEFQDIKQNTYIANVKKAVESHPRKAELVSAFERMKPEEREELHDKYFATPAAKLNPFRDYEGLRKEGIAILEGMIGAEFKLTDQRRIAPGPVMPQLQPLGGVGFTGQLGPQGRGGRAATGGGMTSGGTGGSGGGTPQRAGGGGTSAAPPIPQRPERAPSATSTTNMESPTGTAMPDASGVDAYMDKNIVAAPTAGGVVQGSPDSVPASQKDVDEAVKRAVMNTGMSQIPSVADAYFESKAAQTTPPAPPSTPELDATISSEPIVMNNTNVNSSESTSGGTNFVSGQNLPMTAHNPYLQEFIAKQNVQYQ
jgi:hypothetical protein